MERTGISISSKFFWEPTFLGQKMLVSCLVSTFIGVSACCESSLSVGSWWCTLNEWEEFNYPSRLFSHLLIALLARSDYVGDLLSEFLENVIVSLFDPGVVYCVTIWTGWRLFISSREGWKCHAQAIMKADKHEGTWWVFMFELYQLSFHCLFILNRWSES